MRGKIGVSLGGLFRGYSILDTLKIVKEGGVEAVDFDIALQDYRNKDSIFSKSDDEICDFYSKVKKQADELGLEIGQTHGFFPPVKQDDEEYNKVVVAENSRIDFMVTKVLGAPVCVFHPAGTLTNLTATPEYMRESTFNSIKNALESAKKYGVKFGLETVGSNYDLNNTIDFFGDFNEYQNLYSRVMALEEYKDYFTCCVDTGHTNMAVQFGHPTPGDLIRKMGKNVTALHLHDNDGYIDHHALLEEGTVNWTDVFDALYEIGYTGNYNSEASVNADTFASSVARVELTVNTIKKYLSRYSL